MLNFGGVHTRHRNILKILQIPILNSLVGGATGEGQSLRIVLHTSHLVIRASWVLRQLLHDFTGVHFPYLEGAADTT